MKILKEGYVLKIEKPNLYKHFVNPNCASDTITYYERGSVAFGEDFTMTHSILLAVQADMQDLRWFK